MKKQLLFIGMALISSALYAERELENKIYQEYINLKKQPGGGIKQMIAVMPGYLVVTKDNSPTLYGLVEACAAGVNIQVPPLVLIFQGNIVSRVLEEIKIADMKCNAAATSLTHALSFFFIGEDLIKDMVNKNGLTAIQLKAIIAHELGHIKHYHAPKILIIAALCWLLAQMLKPEKDDEPQDLAFSNIIPTIPTNTYLGGVVQAQLVGIVSKVLLFEALLTFLKMFLYRKFENEADAEAASILDDPNDLADGLDRMITIAKTKPLALDWVLNWFESHPRNCDRRAALEVLKKQKDEAAKKREATN